MVARQQSLPGAVGDEVELLEHDRPDQSVGAPCFNDSSEDAGATLDLYLDVAYDRLGLSATVGDLRRYLAGFGKTQRGHNRGWNSVLDRLEEFVSR